MKMNDKTERNDGNANEYGNWRTTRHARARSEEGDFLVGDSIADRYQVREILGQGGMGIVYRCFDTVAQIDVALKTLPPELERSREEMEEIKANFRLVGKLSHPNIAVMRTIEEFNGRCFLVMDYVNGVNLRSWARSRREAGGLTVAEVVAVVKQIASALDYAHAEKIIHRDIKPGNIMITPEGKIKLLDFGLAAQIMTGLTHVSMAYQHTSGTGPYMAPEQWRGRAQKARTDQYALGVTIYELFAGHPPFDTPDRDIMFRCVLNEEPEPLEDVPDYVNRAVMKALAKNEADRFETCMEFAQALAGESPVGSVSSSRSARSCADAGGAGGRREKESRTTPPPSDAGTTADQPARRHKRVTVIGVSLLLLFLFFIVKTLSSPKSSRYPESAGKQTATLPERKDTGPEKKISTALPEKKTSKPAWEPGKVHPQNPDLVADQKPDTWKAIKPGYVWTGGANMEWRAGQRSSRYPHWISTETPEYWRGEDGYVKKDPKATGLAELVWKPGWQKDSKRAGQTEGVWETKHTCSICNGSGKVNQKQTCSHCNGDSYIQKDESCSACDGSGQRSSSRSCSNCGGSGQIRLNCTGCGPIYNNGILIAQHGVICSVCGGRGAVPYRPQPSGQGGLSGALMDLGNALRGVNQVVRCSNCNGYGWFNHGECNGTGVVQVTCSTCSGSGSVRENRTCYSCNGTGSKTVRRKCGFCNNGVVTRAQECTSCSGQGFFWR